MSDYNATERKDYPRPCEEGLCPATGIQTVNVSIPVEIKPYAKAGSTKITCFGEPVITPGSKPGCGKKDGSCSFTISQKICVEVPVYFGATTSTGDTFVDCDGKCACEHKHDCPKDACDRKPEHDCPKPDHDCKKPDEQHHKE